MHIYSVVIDVKHIERDLLCDPRNTLWGGTWGVGRGQKLSFLLQYGTTYQQKSYWQVNYSKLHKNISFFKPGCLKLCCAVQGQFLPEAWGFAMACHRLSDLVFSYSIYINNIIFIGLHSNLQNFRFHVKCLCVFNIRYAKPKPLFNSKRDPFITCISVKASSWVETITKLWGQSVLLKDTTKVLVLAGSNTQLLDTTLWPNSVDDKFFIFFFY